MKPSNERRKPSQRKDAAEEIFLPSEARRDFERLKRPNIIRWLIGAVSDWLVIAACFLLIRYSSSWLMHILAVFIIGTRQHALGIVGHDAAHRLASKNRILNDGLSNLLCFWPLTSTVSGYRHFHFLHHGFLGTSKDPELGYKKKLGSFFSLPASPFQLAGQFLIRLLGLRPQEIGWAVWEIHPKKFWDIFGMMFFLVGMNGALIYFHQGWIVFYWYLSLFTSFNTLFHFRMWIEHMGTTGTHRVHLNPVLAWILAPHYTWLHWEHHRWASIPYWNLSKARRLYPFTPIMSFKDLLKFYQQYTASNLPASAQDGGPSNHIPFAA